MSAATARFLITGFVGTDKPAVLWYLGENSSLVSLKKFATIGSSSLLSTTGLLEMVNVVSRISRISPKCAPNYIRENMSVPNNRLALVIFYLPIKSLLKNLFCIFVRGRQESESSNHIQAAFVSWCGCIIILNGTTALSGYQTMMETLAGTLLTNEKESW